MAAAAWLAAGLGAVTSPVRADRPLQTEDAGILDRGDCEIELWHHTHAERDAPDGRGNAAQLKCGLGWRTDAFIAGLQGRADDQWLRAWGLGAKRELWTADTDALSLSAYTLLSRIGDAGWRQDTSRVALAYSHEGAGPLGWHVNLGHERDHRAGHGSTVWGLAGQYDGPAGLTPVLEAYGDDREPPWWNAELRWRALPGRLQLDVAYGRQLSGSAPSLLTVGLKLSL